MPKTRPTTPTVIDAKGIPSSTEQIPHTRIEVTESDLSGLPEATARNLSRILGQIQDNAIAASRAGRSDVSVINATQTITTSGSSGSPQTVYVRHGLGKAFRNWDVVRQYEASNPWSGVEAAGNGGRDVSEYLALRVTCTGKYDVRVW